MLVQLNYNDPKRFCQLVNSTALKQLRGTTKKNRQPVLTPIPNLVAPDESTQFPFMFFNPLQTNELYERAE
jgi:hypothetical protein